MLRIGICDDIYDARLVLRAALERVLEKRRVQGQFREFSSGEGLLRWLESHAGELDLVFLDMEMGELDGMETARRLRAADAGLQLVFVTGYAEHVFDGYSVGALGYLLKPPTAEQLGLDLEDDAALPVVLINDGRVIRRNLTACGRDEAWLRKQLSREKASSPREIFLLTLDEQGQVFCVRKERES